MRVGAKVIGAAVIVTTLLVMLFAVRYTGSLAQQRNETVTQLASLPEHAQCSYGDSTCPQAQGNIVLPDVTGIALVLLALLLGLYLLRSERTSKGILDELRMRRSELSSSERRDLVLSVLTKDERRVIDAVLQQPGISQATLRLRTDFSKAKLSVLLKELERRGLVAKSTEGKTNAVYPKREL